MSLSPAQVLAGSLANAPGLSWPGGAMDRGALCRDVAGLASAIRAACPTGSIVGIFSRSRLRIALGVLAADWAGRTALPLDPAGVGARTALERAAPGIVVSDAGLSGPERVPVLSFDDRGTPAIPCAGSGNLVVATSGATGVPRLVRLDAASMAAQAEASARVLPSLAPGAAWLVCMPMTSIGALAALWRTFRAGAGLAVLESFDPPAAASLMRAGATHVSVVPAMLASLVGQFASVPGGLACVLAGGGPLSRAAADQALEARWPLWTGWGMTETASHVAAGPVDRDWEPGIAGRPLPGISIRQDPATGRLRVAGPTLMRGYLGQEDPAGLEPDGSLLTSDAGEITADGRLRILGRADQVIVTGGVNVHPEAVEALLADCPGLGDAAVAGISDPDWGQRLLALYTGACGPEQADAHARRHWSARGLPSALRVPEAHGGFHAAGHHAFGARPGGEAQHGAGAAHDHGFQDLPPDRERRILRPLPERLVKGHGEVRPGLQVGQRGGIRIGSGLFHGLQRQAVHPRPRLPGPGQVPAAVDIQPPGLTAGSCRRLLQGSQFLRPGPGGQLQLHYAETRLPGGSQPLRQAVVQGAAERVHRHGARRRRGQVAVQGQAGAAGQQVQQGALHAETRRRRVPARAGRQGGVRGHAGQPLHGGLQCGGSLAPGLRARPRQGCALAPAGRAPGVPGPDDPAGAPGGRAASAFPRPGKSHGVRAQLEGDEFRRRFSH
ncbi:MAG: AMP-binding protein [Gammaproteobacteria bacterium]